MKFSRDVVNIMNYFTFTRYLSTVKLITVPFFSDMYKSHLC